MYEKRWDGPIIDEEEVKMDGHPRHFCSVAVVGKKAGETISSLGILSARVGENHSAKKSDERENGKETEADLWGGRKETMVKGRVSGKKHIAGRTLLKLS